MKTMDTKLEPIRMTLSKAISDPEVLALLSRRGYGIEELQEGLALYALARDSAQNQGVARFSRVNATQTFHQRWRVVRIQYNHDVRLARLALKEYQGSRYFLQLDGTRTQAFGEWYEQAKEFYSSLTTQPDLLAAVAALGLTSERINQGIQQLQILEAARSQQQDQTGSAISTQRQRSAALDALNQWMTTFRRYARLALASVPEHLTTLGLDTSSQRTNKKVVMLPNKVESPAQSAMTMLTGD